MQRGTAAGVIDLPVPIAGKTGTTNDAKDVWFVGFSSATSSRAAISASTAALAGPHAYGGRHVRAGASAVHAEGDPEIRRRRLQGARACQFIKIDRFTGARLGDSASGPNVVAECFREGEEPIFGIQFDGGFAMGGSFD